MTIVTSSSDPVPRPNERQPAWCRALELAVRDPMVLCSRLELPEEYYQGAIRAAHQFPLCVPQEYLVRIRPGDPQDPLLRQVLPVRDELEDTPGFSTDPVGDRAADQGQGILQKYAQRALILMTGACAVHCRYCFRRHFSHSSNLSNPKTWDPVRRRLSNDPTIQEVILSGGDPLTLRDSELRSRISDIADIQHIRRLRIHTRLPVMIPQRVTESLLGAIGRTRLNPIVVVQVNHTAELDSATASALSRFVDSGVPVLNQAVLLRGVNDSFESQRDLCARLAELRIIPYYLHQLDRVLGAAHFEVPVEQGQQIIRQLRDSLPGYAVPRYVRDDSSQSHKTVLA